MEMHARVSFQAISVVSYFTPLAAYLRSQQRLEIGNAIGVPFSASRIDPTLRIMRIRAKGV